MNVVQIASNAVAAVVANPTRDLDLLMQQLLSYQVAGAENSDAYQSGSWDGRSSFYEMRHHRFPAGFVQIIRKALIEKGYKVHLRQSPLPEPLGPERPLFDPYGYEDERYAYQWRTVETLCRHGRMIAQIATGGGKSRIAQMAAIRIKRPTLFLTTRSVLMYQMRDHFQSMQEWIEPGVHTVGVLGDGEWAPRRWICVGMVQTLAARLKGPSLGDDGVKREKMLRDREEALKLLKRFEFVILEEAHEASGNSYYDILKRCSNAHYRLALTATPFMKEDEEANMNLMAAAGPIGIRVTEKQLIDSGILAKPYFKYLTPEKPRYLARSTAWQAAYRLGIVESLSRNSLILKEAITAASHGLSVLVLVQQQKHGKVLEKAFKANNMRCKFIFGETSKKVRAAALDSLVSGKVQVLIGSNILDVGVDVPALGMVILAGGGKAEVQLRQRIGRGLRAKKDGPNIAYIIDFMDVHNKYLHRHSLARRKIIEDTPGFDNILLSGENFDYSVFGR